MTFFTFTDSPHLSIVVPPNVSLTSTQYIDPSERLTHPLIHSICPSDSRYQRLFSHESSTYILLLICYPHRLATGRMHAISSLGLPCHRHRIVLLSHFFVNCGPRAYPSAVSDTDIFYAVKMPFEFTSLKKRQRRETREQVRSGGSPHRTLRSQA